MALSKTTQDHEEIQRWAEARGAVPSEVASTETAGEVGILRFEFPGAKNANDSNLKEISWEDFFEKFDKSGLALVYQEVTAEGAESNFNKLVHPENISASAKKGSKKGAAKKTSGGRSSGSRKSAPAKKSALVKKSASKKSAKKTSSSGRGSTSTKSAAKKSSSAKAPAKKSAAKKSPAKKAAKKAPAKAARKGAKKSARKR